jgi:hypothetical protein
MVGAALPAANEVSSGGRCAKNAAALVKGAAGWTIAFKGLGMAGVGGAILGVATATGSSVFLGAMAGARLLTDLLTTVTDIPTPVSDVVQSVRTAET